MPPITDLQMQDVAIVLLVCLGSMLVAAIALLVVAAQQVRELDIPEDADFFETMQAIPITVPIALDLLDGVFDVFAAPISWVVLELLGLGALKAITLVEGLIPGTQLIPTMTVAWAVSRWMKSTGRSTPFRSALREQQLATRGQYPRITRGRGASSRADYYRQQALPSGRRSGTVGGRVMVDGEMLDEGGSPRRLPGGIAAEGEDVVEGEFYDETDREERRRRVGRDDYEYDGEEFVDGEE